ncbi:hypothetical protein [Pseudomonas sp.]|uniref:hypothetical protein n=1 Tax=Pseudomonas sp. TaxID=306 RepID=UPI002730840B|nr:hypothetical protein [Pseudomonas sp.]MDP2444165.1 hypothetical protein [Pseudomonas sp.]MDZ4337121.1 hypothetical protein [Pseudomonas sp.]
MAKKPEAHIVIDGCIQEGKKVYVKGVEYTPPSAELAAQLVAAGTIAPIRSATAQAVMRTAAPAPTPATPATPTADDLLQQQDE